MRIIQLIQKPQLRGAEIFACQLASHLMELGHEVKVICLFDGNAVLPFKGDIVNLRRPANARLFDWHGWKALALEIKTFKADIVQANAGDTLKYSVFSRMFFRWDAAIVFRNANKVSDLITSKIVWTFNNFLVSNVDYVISVSRLCVLNIRETYKVSDEKSESIPIGIELNHVEEILADDVAYYFGAAKVLLNVASLVPEKNHEGLVRIVKKLVDEGFNIKALIVGGGRLQPAIEKLILELNLQNHVFLLGYRTDVLPMMKKSDLFVLPSRTEGLPGVILESFYQQLPVVATNVGGISEVVQNENTGWLVEAGNEDEFMKAVKDALNNPNKAAMARINAFNLVTTEYSNKNIAQKFLKAYRKVLSHKD